MSDKAETVTCGRCRGVNPLGCPACSGTGVRTTGAVVNATGHDGCIRGLDKAKATIAAQAAEIEALKGHCFGQGELLSAFRIERDDLLARVEQKDIEVDRFAIVYADHSKTISRLSAEMDEMRTINRTACSARDAATTDRDVLRLEVQRLKDLNHESQDLYAAIEAERDELRAEVEQLNLRLTESLVELGTAEKEIAHMRESNGRADDYSVKLERVVEALRYELAGVVHCQAATIRSIVRLANAGLELPEEPDNG